MLKLILRAAASGLASYGALSLIDRGFHDWGAAPAERARALPGDELVPEMGTQSTMAITINAPRAEVWPWLVQMGRNRAGWYSYDFLDNGGVPSASRILPEFQDIAVGYVIPADLENEVGFPVLLVEPERALVLGKVVSTNDRQSIEYPGVRGQTVWSFVLEEPVAGTTRLLVRTRSEPQLMLERILSPVWGVAHSLMQRKQLTSIRRRAESRPARHVPIAPRLRPEVKAAG